MKDDRRFISSGYAPDYPYLRLLHDAAEMLRRLEWADMGICPVCQADEHGNHSTHFAGCELAALLKRLEGV